MKIMALFGMMLDADAMPAISGAKGARIVCLLTSWAVGLRSNCRVTFVVSCVQAEIAAQLSHL